MRVLYRLGSILVGLICSVALFSCTDEPPKERFNIILISIDSLRADHVHSYGYPKETTPNLDRLAWEGVLFETVVAESSWTLPTHMTMLSGLPSAVHGVEYGTGPRLNPEVPTLAEILQQAGYRTGGFYSGPNLHPVFGFGKGFETYEGVIGKVLYDEESFDLNASKPAVAKQVTATNRMSHRTITSPLVTRKAIDFVSENKGQPFFLFLHYFDVHYDYIPPEKIWRKFDPDYQGSLTAHNYAKNPAINHPMDPRELEHIIALYDGEILFTDEHIGYVIDALDRNGLTDNTLVMVTSDHGQEFFEHEDKGHARTLFDEVLLVPLIMRLPGHIEAGKRIKEQVRHLDIMSTLLPFAGLPENLDGANLSEWIEGKVAPRPLEAMSRLYRQGLYVSMRTPQYKYITFRQRRTETETLYDIQSEPRELRPVFWRQQRLRSRSAQEPFERLKGLLVREELEALRSAARQGHREDDAIELPEDLQERLKALGYLQ